MIINTFNREPMAIALAKQEFKKGVERDLFYLIINQVKTGLNIKEDLFRNVEIKIPAKWLKETNYQRIREAADKITSRKIRFINEENKEFRYIVPFPDVSYAKGELRIIMLDTIAREFMELSKGYTEYQLETMQSFKSDYTQRLYEILSGKKKMNGGVWKNVSIDYLKEVLNASVYTMPGNFIQKVIEVAKREMDAKGDITFEYEKIRTGRKLTNLTFTIYYVGEDERFQEMLQGEYDEIAKLDNVQKASLVNSLIKQYNFTTRQQEKLISNNELLSKFYEINRKIEEGIIKDVKDKTKYMAACLGFNKK